MRVVSTTCSNTEIVCALGCAELLVGVDDHSDYPPEVVEALPRVGPDLQVDPARVAALEPDLVLASLTVPGHEKVVASLEAAGLRVIAPEPTSIDDVYADIRLIAGLLGVPERGEALARELAERLAPRPRLARQPRIMVEWWPKPAIAAGQRSWVADLIERAGGVCALEEDVASRPLTPEDAAAMAPDAVVISWCGVPTHKYRASVVRDRPGWAQIPAVASDQIHPVAEAYLGRPGPRLAEGLDALRAVVEGLQGSM